MPNSLSLNEVYKNIAKTEAKRHEAEVRAANESARREIEIEKERSKEFNKIAKEIGLDTKKIDAIHKKEEKDLAAYIEQIRSPLSNRKKADIEGLQHKSTGLQVSEQAAMKHAELLGLTILAPSKEFIKGIPGKTGNSWVLPNNRDKIKIYSKARGWRLGGQADGSQGKTWAEATFNYVPAKTGNIEIAAWIIFHGFYLSKADDTCFPCNCAELTLDVWMDVLQHTHWQGWKNETVLHISGDKIDESGTFDEEKCFDYSALVKANDSILIQVNIGLDTRVNGSESYSELNFNDGEANYLWIPCVTITEEPLYF